MRIEAKKRFKLRAVLIFLMVMVLCTQMIPNLSSMAGNKPLKNVEQGESKIKFNHYNLEEMPEMVRSAVNNSEHKPVEIVEDGAENLNTVTVKGKD